MAARTKLTPVRRAEVERHLAAGTPVAVAAQRVGIGRRTLTRWIAEGRVVRRELVVGAVELELDDVPRKWPHPRRDMDGE